MNNEGGFRDRYAIGDFSNVHENCTDKLEPVMQITEDDVWPSVRGIVGPAIVPESRKSQRVSNRNIIM
jgi:hypothetical protein